MKKIIGLWSEPSPPHLKKSIDTLIQTYHPRNNRARQQQIHLIKAACTRGVTMVPTLIYVYCWIKSKYEWGGNPIASFYAPENSLLYKHITQALEISPENPMDAVSEFAGLIHFIQYLLESEQPTHVARAVALAKTAKQKNADAIKTLISRLPAHSALKTHFSDIKKNYLLSTQNASSVLSWLHPHHPKRMKSLQFLSTLDEQIGERCSEIDHLLRCGALIHVMHEIESEYTIMSPENSCLYREIQEITGLKRSADLCFEPKQALLTQLNALLCQAHLEEEKMALWEDSGISRPDLLKIEEEIVHYHAELIEFRECEFTDSPSANKLINHLLDCIAHTIAQTGIVFACIQIARFSASTSIPLSIILAAATPQNAALLMGSLWLLAQCRGNLTHYATQTTQHFISPLLRIPLQTLSHKEAMIDHIDEKTTLLPQEQRLLKALYDAPDDIVCAREKQQLENIFPSIVLSESEKNHISFAC